MKPSISIRRGWLALTLAYVALVFLASSRPYFYPPGPDFVLKDKFVHALEYGLLAYLASRALRPGRAAGGWVAVLFVVAVGASIGAADELFQGTVPGRVTDVYDWVADVAGLALGASLLAWNRRRVERTAGAAQG
jgi:VanZ family protein